MKGIIVELTVIHGMDLLKAHQEKRAGGIHLTNIIQRMARDGRAEFWEDYQKLSQADQQIYENSFFEPGFLWEEVLSHTYAERWAKRPDPFEFDGIWMSPDGVFRIEQLNSVYGMISSSPILAEFKWTSSKNDKFPDHPSKTNWIIQTKSYCYGMGLDKVIFVVAYSKGDYKWLKLKGEGGVEINCPSPPDVKSFLIHYTDEELISNWENVSKYRDILLEESHASE